MRRTGSSSSIPRTTRCGFFLYIGASDLLPESHARHPAAVTGALNVAGASLIWVTIHLTAF